MEREKFISSSTKILGEIYDNIMLSKELNIDHLNPERTALVIVDMVNGFAREGALKSSRVEGIIGSVIKLMRLCREREIPAVAFADTHSERCVEFGAYPPHCIKGTSEAEIVEEIRNEGSYTLFEKNSTNGFIEEGFQRWLSENPGRDTFIIVGDCTDICVLQFALNAKTYFNSSDKASRIIVPMDAVETYDLGAHNAELMNVMALQIMQWNGIEIVSGINRIRGER